MTQINGVVNERFAAVAEALQRNFADPGEIGASAAVVHNGELVVDIWAGHTDEQRTQEWEKDTITNVWSTTKTMMAISALVLADRGELDFTYTDCDGTIPPLGFFKCKVQFNFPSALNVISAQIGAGVLTKAVFFKIQKQEWIH